MTDRITSRESDGADRVDAWRLLPEGAVAAFRSDMLAGPSASPP